MVLPLSRLGPYDSQIIFDGTPQALRKATDPRVSQFVRGEAGERLLEMNGVGEQNSGGA